MLLGADDCDVFWCAFYFFEAVFLSNVWVLFMFYFRQKHFKRTNPEFVLVVESAINNYFFPGLSMNSNILDIVKVALKMAIKPVDFYLPPHMPPLYHKLSTEDNSK